VELNEKIKKKTKQQPSRSGGWELESERGSSCVYAWGVVGLLAGVKMGKKKGGEGAAAL